MSLKKPRRRKFISLETKLSVVQSFERGDRLMDIVRSFGLNEATCRTIRSNAEKIKASSTVSPYSATKISHSRCLIMETMERNLIAWIQEQDSSLGMHAIMTKALELYDALKPNFPMTAVKPFLASQGWYMRFKKRLDSIQNNVTSISEVEIKQEMDVSNEEAEPEAEDFEKLFKRVVGVGEYSPKQVINLVETGLFWNTLPQNTMDNAPRDKCSLILGGNAYGDLKLKPLMIYHTSNPKPLSGYSKEHLPVVLRSSPDGASTPSIFLEYFNIHLHREMKDYCELQNIDFKILLLIENSATYPASICDLSKSIKVLFMPPNANDCVQPMDQGILTTFKAQYLGRVFDRLLNGGANLQLTWSKFNVRDAIDLISDAWGELTELQINAMWRNLWPECVYADDNPLSDIVAEILAVAKELGFRELNECDVNEYLRSHDDDFTGHEMELLARDANEEDDGLTMRVLSRDKLCAAFRLLEQALEIFDENDSDRERSSKVLKDINSSIACYKELHREKLRHCNF